MGDKSPKSKKRDQAQKAAGKVRDVNAASAKRASNDHTPATPAKGKK